MKILLLNPPRFNKIPVIREERCEITERYSVLPPYSLLQLASILRRMGNIVDLIDANGLDLGWSKIERMLKMKNYDLLIFRFTPTTFDWDMRVAYLSKTIHPTAKTAGICWTLQSKPQEVLSESAYLDIYIRHEYEVVVPELCKVLSEGKDISSVEGIAYRENNKIKINAACQINVDWDDLPLPAYDLLPSLKPYFINTPYGSPFTIIYSSKGCPYSCIFCTVRKTKLKIRSADSIMKELRYLKKHFNIRTVSFFDETFTIDKKRTIAISEKMKNEGLGIVWYCNTRVNLVDKKLLKVMYEGGCRGISYGIESGSQKILDLSKKMMTVRQAEDAIRWAKNVGIKVYCSFIFGLPGESMETIKETLNFVKRALPTGAQFNVAVPYPGTELFDFALKKGWINGEVNWKKFYQHESVMQTEYLSREDLNKVRKIAYRSLYFNPQWWVQNAWFSICHAYDLPIAIRYAKKIIRNYFVNKMQHVH